MEVLKTGRVLSAKNEDKLRKASALVDEVLSALDKEEEKPAEGKDVEDPEYKGAIPFKDHGIAPETEPWDGPGQTSKADTKTLKIICAWYDSAKPDEKGSYKLPHHNADGYKAVWRGVAAAMAALLGARGGVNIPDADRKGVYNHLAKHYKQFDKVAPDFKMVEDQVLAGFEEEIQALSLDRQDKHEVRLIKKVIDGQKVNDKRVIEALKIIDLTLSKVVSS